MAPENRPTLELLRGAHKIGVRGLCIPKEFGGTPLDPATKAQTIAMVSEDISRGDSGLGDKPAQIWKVSMLLANVAPRHLQEYCFAKIAGDPSFLPSHALTEPRGAFDRRLHCDVPEAMMHTRAVKKGNRWVINGRKQFSPRVTTPSSTWPTPPPCPARASPRAPPASCCHARASTLCPARLSSLPRTWVWAWALLRKPLNTCSTMCRASACQSSIRQWRYGWARCSPI